MAENTKMITLRKDGVGTVKMDADLITVIAALAATEVNGVSSMAGNLTHELIRRMGMRSLSSGVRTQIEGEEVSFDLSVNVDFGRSITDVSKEIQERVKNTVETMTGLTVREAAVRIADVDMQGRA